MATCKEGSLGSGIASMLVFFLHCASAEAQQTTPPRLCQEALQCASASGSLRSCLSPPQPPSAENGFLQNPFTCLNCRMPKKQVTSGPFLELLELILQEGSLPSQLANFLSYAIILPLSGSYREHLQTSVNSAGQTVPAHCMSFEPIKVPEKSLTIFLHIVRIPHSPLL